MEWWMWGLACLGIGMVIFALALCKIAAWSDERLEMYMDEWDDEKNG